VLDLSRDGKGTESINREKDPDIAEIGQTLQPTRRYSQSAHRRRVARRGYRQAADIYVGVYVKYVKTDRCTSTAAHNDEHDYSPQKADTE